MDKNIEKTKLPSIVEQWSFLAVEDFQKDYNAFLGNSFIFLSEGSPVPVGIDVQVESIDSISEVNMVSFPTRHWASAEKN